VGPFVNFHEPPVASVYMYVHRVQTVSELVAVKRIAMEVEFTVLFSVSSPDCPHCLKGHSNMTRGNENIKLLKKNQ
jgi:hypothetical protein